MAAPQLTVTNGKVDVTDINSAFTEVDQNIETHKAKTNNPHGVTAAQVGLGNADNTPDVDKPVSTAQQTALDDKSDIGHGHEIGDVTGLQGALDGKSATGHGHEIADVSGLAEALAAKVPQEDLDGQLTTDVARPGEDSAQFSAILTGDPAARPVIVEGLSVVDDDLGAVWSLPGAASIAPRRAYALELGRIYRLRVVVKRLEDSSDPNNDAVEIRWQNLNKTKGAVSNIALHTYSDLLVATGAVEFTALISRDVGGADYVPPATARFGVPEVRTYGADGKVGIASVVWQDVTEEVAIAGDIEGLQEVKAPLASPTLTGIPTAPTAPPGTNSVQVATTGFMQAALSALVETALNDDPDFAATMTTALATKAPLEAPSFTGDVHVSGQIITEDDFEADARPVAGGIASEDGAGLMSVSDDGTLVAAGLDLVGCDPVFELEADALPGAETVVSDAEQPVVALGGAGLDLLLSSYSLSRLLDQMSAGAALRCGVMARGVTTGHALRRGSVCDRDGYTLRVAERVYGAGDAAVIQGSSPMEFFPGLGQSNVMWGGVANGGNNPRKLIGPVYPYSVFGFQQTGAVGAASPVFATTSAATEVDPADLGDFLPYHDWISQPAHPQGAHVMAATAVEMAERAAGRAGPGVVAHADWNGGEPIQTFVEGGAPFENVIHHAVRAQQIAALYSRDMVCRAVLFTQGESGGTTYEDTLDGIVTALRARVQAALSQPSAPAVLIHQTNDSDTAASNSLYCLNQLAVYESRPSEAPIVGPMYQSRLTDSGIHGDAESRMMLGEVVGEVYRRLKDGEPWYPVMIHSASRSGAVITLKYTASDTTYRLPGDDLEFDPGPGQPGDGWVEPIVDYGFYYTDDSSGASISSVSIVKDPNGRATRVQITLDGDPGAATGKKIRYALCDAGDVAADGWSSGRGQLRSRGRRSSFRDLGHAVPEFIYFYAVRQEIDL